MESGPQNDGDRQSDKPDIWGAINADMESVINEPLVVAVDDFYGNLSDHRTILESIRDDDTDDSVDTLMIEADKTHHSTTDLVSECIKKIIEVSENEYERVSLVTGLFIAANNNLDDLMIEIRENNGSSVHDNEQFRKTITKFHDNQSLDDFRLSSVGLFRRVFSNQLMAWQQEYYRKNDMN